MSAYHVVRSINIQSSKEKIMKSLSNYKEWPRWSPWLIMEPSATLEYNDKQGEVGAYYSWSGDMVGEGEMTLTEITDAQLEMKLNFIKPFKSQARVEFHIEEKASHCEVNWHMYGNLPFFMSMMKEKMQAWIAMDYDRGLLMLKAYVEDNKVPSRVSIEQEASIENQLYVGLANEATIKDVGSVIQADYKKLYDLFTENNWPIDVIPFSIYNSMDMISTKMTFISSLPIKDKVSLEAPFLLGELDSSKALKVTHTGDYPYLGNAWSTAMVAVKFYKKKQRKQPLGIERYLNDPQQTPADELITEILIPIK